MSVKGSFDRVAQPLAILRTWLSGGLGILLADVCARKAGSLLGVGAVGKDPV
jgi:hypothetical protein